MSPFLFNTAAKSSPATTLITSSSTAELLALAPLTTDFGTFEFEVAPLPNCPLLLVPQEYTLPEFVNANAKSFSDTTLINLTFCEFACTLSI